MAGTNFYSPITGSCGVVLTSGNTSLGASQQYALVATCTGTPPTTASTFDKGCLMVNTETGTLSVNVGTVATPSWAAVTHA